MEKAVSLPFNIVSSVTLTGNTIFTSSVSGVQYRDSVAYGLTWTNAHAVSGSASIDLSLDYNPSIPQGGGTQRNGNWASMVSYSIGSGTVQPLIFNLAQVACPWSRVNLAIASGSATFNVFVMAKSWG